MTIDCNENKTASGQSMNEQIFIECKEQIYHLIYMYIDYEWNNKTIYWLLGLVFIRIESL